MEKMVNVSLERLSPEDRLLSCSSNHKVNASTINKSSPTDRMAVKTALVYFYFLVEVETKATKPSLPSTHRPAPSLRCIR